MVFVGAFFVSQFLSAPVTKADHRFCVNYSRHPDLNELKKFDIAIISPYADVDIHSMTRNAHRPFAYLSVVEIATDAPYREAVTAAGIPTLGRNEIWGGDLADVRDPRWHRLIIEQLAADAMRRGFKGFFLDTVDSIQLLAKMLPNQRSDFEAGMIGLVRGLKTRYPDKPIIINRGFELFPRLQSVIDGVLCESLYGKYDFKRRAYTLESPEGSRWLLNQLNRIKTAGKDVYVVDYVNPSKPELARQISERIHSHGFHAFVSTVELNGRHLDREIVDLKPSAGARAVSRKILGLIGNSHPDIEVRVDWALDSGICQLAQVPMDWFGYECDYVNIWKDELPTATGKYRAIMLDRFLELPPARENQIADWLIAQKNAGERIIFFGTIPFRNPDVRRRVLRAFGIGGSGETIDGVINLRKVKSSPQMDFEVKAPLTPVDFQNLEAPPGADVLFSLTAQSRRDGKTYRFDPIFLTGWGGALLDPHCFFMRPDEEELWQVDPFYFFGRAIGAENFPRPDVTTRDGVRIFFAHIDGDGFRHKSGVEFGRRSGDLLFEKIVKPYPFPITASIIEAEITAIIDKQDPADRPLLTRQSREVFALEKVEAGSHTYSHPYYWNYPDRTIPIYDRQNLDLKKKFQPIRPAKGVGSVDIRREVVGSVEYINNELLPPGKKVEIMLWSGNCRPWPEALSWCRKLGIENMNGGDTYMTRVHPSFTKVASHTITWGDELQVHCAHQNENLYRFRWQGGATPDTVFWGGFVGVIDSFNNTELPRRLKAVNIYYHWYSGDNLASFNALKKVYDWCLKQELHSLTAAPYARIVRDSRKTRVFRTGSNRWLMLNDGFCRTFRLDDEGLVPDLAASHHVIGWRRVNKSIYVHTDGSPRVELALTAQPREHLYLESSTAEIRVHELTPHEIWFFAKDYRPGRVVLAGVRPHQPVTLALNGKTHSWKADANGQLKMQLPADADVRLRLKGAPHHRQARHH